MSICLSFCFLKTIAFPQSTTSHPGGQSAAHAAFSKRIPNRKSECSVHIIRGLLHRLKEYVRPHQRYLWAAEGSFFLVVPVWVRCVHTTQRHPKYTEVEQFCRNDFVVVVVSGAAVAAAVAAAAGAAVVINHKLLLLFLNITITTKNISIKKNKETVKQLEL